MIEHDEGIWTVDGCEVSRDEALAAFVRADLSTVSWTISIPRTWTRVPVLRTVLRWLGCAQWRTASGEGVTTFLAHVKQTVGLT